MLADTGEPALLKAGLAHLWFVTLHPFDDGNGRHRRPIPGPRRREPAALALRDINELVVLRVLRKSPGGGRSTAYEVGET